MQSLILSPSFSTALWASLWASLRASYSNGFCPHDRDLHLHPVIDSTNTEARRRAASDGDRVTLDIAGEQTGGRGRLGRSFHSPGGTGLYMTLGYTLHGPRTAAVTVTAQAAVAAATAIESLTGKSVGIKWVNDLYLLAADDTHAPLGKLAGILCEAVPLDGDATRILVGWGINLTTRSFPSDLRAPAASLLSPDEEDTLTADFMGKLAGDMAGRLLSRLADTSDENATACLASYRRRLLYVGSRVLCSRGSETFEATLRGVENDYSLLVEVDGKLRSLSSGEISVRVK